MIYYHIKLALRRLTRQKAYSIVNLIGLSLGFATCLIVFLYIQDENRFDKFHLDHERLFRVTTIETDEGVSRHLANAYAPLAALLNTGFPGAKQIVRFFPFNGMVKNPANNALFQEPNFCLADSLFFEVFDFYF